MVKDYLYKLADRFEGKLKKLAAMPNQASIHSLIQNVFASNANDPILKGCTGIAPEVSLSGGGFGDPMLVYFQVLCEPRTYEEIMRGPRRQQILNLLKTKVEQQLPVIFRQYEFRVTVGIMPSK